MAAVETGGLFLSPLMVMEPHDGYSRVVASPGKGKFLVAGAGRTNGLNTLAVVDAASGAASTWTFGSMDDDLESIDVGKQEIGGVGGLSCACLLGEMSTHSLLPS